MSRMRHVRSAVFAIGLVLQSLTRLQAQQPTRFDRDRVLIMLSVIRDDLQKNCFDSTCGGADLATAFDPAADRVKKAGSNGEMLAALAQARSMTAKGSGARRFDGKLVVLINSASALASELLARTTQLTRRGTVLGDRSAGAVRESRIFAHQVGVEVVVPYAVSDSVGDLVMPGGTLEKVGVTPDEIMLPGGEDLAAGRDPVLSRAPALAGLTISPEAAGALLRHK